MRMALIVGINYYEHSNALYGCVDDAHAVKAVLERHGDGSINFDCNMFGSLSITGEGGADFEEEVFLVSVAVGAPLNDLDSVVNALNDAGV
ncbi:caspase family protein [Pandoraea oxalativorans]|uniref:caspase family protein n=1 Tax=Pandoraea oxalativorans TaxID=573737 RepID=UPI0026D07F81